MARTHIDYWDGDIARFDSAIYDEEQFYVVYPFILRFGSSFVWLLAAASFILCRYWSQNEETRIWRFYLISARLWEFAVGVLLSNFMEKRSMDVKRLMHRSVISTMNGMLCTALLILTFAFTPEGEGYPYPYGLLLPILATISFILGGREGRMRTYLRHVG